MSWSDEKHDVLKDITDTIIKAREAYEYERQHPKGSESNPMEFFVPSWVLRLAEEEGTTAEEAMARVLPYGMKFVITGVD